MARRQTGVLLPLELDILSAGIDLQIANGSFHGFALAKTLSAPGHALTAHGTLYKALARMTASGLLEAEWEASEIGETAGRPRRRLYRVTGLGAEALASAVDDAKPAAAAGWAFS